MTKQFNPVSLGNMSQLDRPRKLHRRTPQRPRRRSPVTLLLLLLFWSAILGWGLAHATASVAQTPESTPIIDSNGTVDVVLDRYQLGQQFYVENCARCHVPLPPAVMPTQTWAALLPDSQHYGAQIQPIVEPILPIVWSYVSTYSRPVLKNERIPYRLAQSRYFKALHPQIELTQPVTVATCASCHPAAAQFNYRSLTPEWQQAQ